MLFLQDRLKRHLGIVRRAPSLVCALSSVCKRAIGHVRPSKWRDSWPADRRRESGEMVPADERCIPTASLGTSSGTSR